MESASVSENIGYIPGAVNIGVIRNGGDAVLIDTGLDKDSGRKALRLLEEQGLTLKAIINTHSHADHFGGNAYLVRNSGAKVYAPSIESGIIQNPLLEPIYLFHGATPIRNLRNKFVLAKPSPVDVVIEPGKLEVIGLELEIVPLPGHCYNQIGVLFDDVLFCADTVFSTRVLEKYRIPVVQDVKNHIETLEKLAESSHRYYIPAHTRPREDIKEITQKNLNTTHRIIEDIKKILETPKSTEHVVSELASMYGLDLTVVQQYYLIQMTVMAYLGYLYDEKITEIEMSENNLYWKISS